MVKIKVSYPETIICLLGDVLVGSQSSIDVDYSFFDLAIFAHE
jgi:hypothetical protein